MDPKWPLFYLPSIVGGIMLIGGIYLLAKRKIYLDKETKQAITDITLPFGLKLKTNTPVLVYFLFGVALMVWPMLTTGAVGVQKCVIRGSVRADTHPVQVYAVIKSDSLMQDRQFSIVVPRLFEAGETYKILYVCQNVIDEDLADLEGLTGNTVDLPTKEVSLPDQEEYERNVVPVPAEFK